MVWRTILFAFLMAGSAVSLAQQNHETDETRAIIRQILTQACEKNHTEEKIETAMHSVTTFASCLRDLMNADVIAKEVLEAKKNGALDEVFRKYCIKSPQLKECINNVVEGIAPCIDSSNRDQLLTGKKATDQLLDFVCYKDGDRIAMFIAEGGPECFAEKRPHIEHCFFEIKSSIDALKREKNALFLDEQCAKYDDLAACIVRAVEACSTPTPGNMVEALFKYVRNELPCKKQR